MAIVAASELPTRGAPRFALIAALTAAVLAVTGAALCFWVLHGASLILDLGTAFCF